jgi:SAM-dependent methyltransferase
VSTFQHYSAYYDLLYRDKDYAAEAEYVARTIRSFVPGARTVLELGSGTGRHGRLLAGLGFDVHGIERSAEMVSVATAASAQAAAPTAGSFTCEVGDLCTATVGRTFDAVISLFHVISYQTTNQALLAAFHVAANHVGPGGVFLFDVWHGPAVLMERPAVRVKEVADERHRVTRTARPELDTNGSTVKVVYEMECEHRESGETFQFSEEHLMRYLLPTEIDLLASSAGLRRVAFEEFLTGSLPSPSTWGVTYVLQK